MTDNGAPTPDPGSIREGILLTLGLHLAALVVFCAGGLVVSGSAMGGCIPFLGIGLLQLLWIIPASIVLSRRSRSATLKGLLVGAGITFLLNATCFGLVMISISNSGFH